MGEAAANGTKMGDIRVLVANEPRSYREVLAVVLSELRRRADVITVDPADLDLAVACHHPHLVVCSRLTAGVQAGAVAWALLYPNGASCAELSLAGERTSMSSIDLGGLLSLFDAAAQLVDGHPAGIDA